MAIRSIMVSHTTWRRSVVDLAPGLRVATAATTVAVVTVTFKAAATLVLTLDQMIARGSTKST
eukprot:946562-Ditylum_brightwellii.AAC.1